uniref:Serine-rich protein-like protein n=1 Tax=Salix viminalis TaxID=40686 RepID=A0A6N2L8C0_SALVM
MERGKIFSKITKVEIPSETESLSSGGAKSTPGLQRQSSATKSNCLCSPTSHAGSFRCRLHRAPSLRRAKSIDSASLRDSETKINSTAGDDSNVKTIEAQ